MTNHLIFELCLLIHDTYKSQMLCFNCFDPLEIVQENDEVKFICETCFQELNNQLNLKSNSVDIVS